MNMYEKLVQYNKMDYYPMHMPGHKRNTEFLNMINPYALDITEIEGFDNLHHAEGIIKEGMDRCAILYGSQHTNYLIGGSTAGILSGIAACTKKGDKVLVARNSHKSVYHAMGLNELEPIYVYPQMVEEFGINGGISPDLIEELLIKHKNIKLIVITSPTYEGIISDIKSISKIAHQHGVPLLVDEAHGAHLGFHAEWSSSSVKMGADIVIHSLHKTLPAFTQTGLIHVNGNLVDCEEVERYLSIYQTSSPSYLLMASIEQCITLLEENKDQLFNAYVDKLHLFYDRMKQLKKIKVLTREMVKNLGFYDLDFSKITISVKNVDITGNQLYFQLLDEYKVQMEMVSGTYVLGMTSICDTEEGFKKLGDALLEIEATCKTSYEDHNESSSMIDTEPPELVMCSHKAYEKEKEAVLLSDSTGRVTAEYIYLYPPGIPLLVPGERVTKSLIDEIRKLKEGGHSIQGMQDKEAQFIKVVAQE